VQRFFDYLPVFIREKKRKEKKRRLCANEVKLVGVGNLGGYLQLEGERTTANRQISTCASMLEEEKPGGGRRRSFRVVFNLVAIADVGHFSCSMKSMLTRSW